MVCTNPRMTTHVHMTIDRPLMSSIDVGRYKNRNVTNPIGGYREPYVVSAQIPNHKDGHSVRPNKVAFKYLDFKKDIDPNAHVKMFNYVVKANVKTSEKYIINAFSNMLKDITLDWCHNYMSKFIDYIFSELTHAFCKHHWKTQTNKQI